MSFKRDWFDYCIFVLKKKQNKNTQKKHENNEFNERQKILSYIGTIVSLVC